MDNEKEIQINREEVENIKSRLSNIWIDNGYTDEYVSESGYIFSSPFQMLEYIGNEGSEEEKVAVDEFESSLVDNDTGFRYWCSRDGLIRLTHYAVKEDIRGINTVCSLMDRYSRRDPKNEHKEESLAIRDLVGTVSEYFRRFGYDQLEYWSEIDNLAVLVKYRNIGRNEPLEFIESKHDALESLYDDENSGIKRDAYESFTEGIKLLDMPGFVSKKYSELRESFIKDLDNPNDLNIILDMVVKERKLYPGVNMLKKIGEISKSEDSIYKGVAKEFISNLLLDPQLYILADTLRRYESDISDSKKDKDLGFSYRDLLNGVFSSDTILKSKEFAKDGYKLFREMLYRCPYLFMDISNEYLSRYASGSIHQDSVDDVERILRVIFSIDMNSTFRYLHDYYSKQREEFESSKYRKREKFIVKRDWKDIQYDENIKFFESVNTWINFWKSASKTRYFSEVFSKNERFFDFLIDSLINTAEIPKDKNHFDNIRMINRLGKKLAEQVKYDIRTVAQVLGDEREEIERMIIKDAKDICTSPKIRLTLGLDERDRKVSSILFYEYLRRYGFFVEGMDTDDLFFSEEVDGFRIRSSNLAPEVMRAIRALGVGFEQDGDTLFSDVDKSSFIKRIAGILVTPTIFEWVEDDKINKNFNNERMRSLFFVPTDVDIFYDKGSGSLISFSNDEKQYFVQNYLQWYLKTKYLTGDIQSLNTVVSTWLQSDPYLRMDINNQRETISSEVQRAWKDVLDGLHVVFEDVRFRRTEVFENLLTATNIEEIIPLIASDRYQLAVLASSLVLSSVKAAQESRVRKGNNQILATLKGKFEGQTITSSIRAEKLDRLNTVIKKLGFKDTEDGLELMMDFWKNAMYLRGNRNTGQTVTITSAGISISNPFKNMYGVDRKKKQKGTEIVDEFVRRYDGGSDKMFISWAQIRSVNEVVYDYIPFKDFEVKVLTAFNTVLGKKHKPDLVKDIERNGPANIVLKLPGRDEPLCEIFALKKPEEFWKTLHGMAELMATEEGASTVVELLSMLDSN